VPYLPGVVVFSDIIFIRKRFFLLCLAVEIPIVHLVEPPWLAIKITTPAEVITGRFRPDSLGSNFDDHQAHFGQLYGGMCIEIVGLFLQAALFPSVKICSYAVIFLVFFLKKRIV